MQARQSISQLSEAEFSGGEPFVLFGYMLYKNILHIEPSYARQPEGLLQLEGASLEAEAKKWARELVQLDFYSTICTFTQAVYDLMETTQTSLFANSGFSSQEAQYFWMRLFYE